MRRPAMASTGTSRRRASADIEALGERFYRAVCKRPGETMAVLAAELGSSPQELNRPMTQLKRQGRVRSVGQRQFTRYFPLTALQSEEAGRWVRADRRRPRSPPRGAGPRRPLADRRPFFQASACPSNSAERRSWQRTSVLPLDASSPGAVWSHFGPAGASWSSMGLASGSSNLNFFSPQGRPRLHSGCGATEITSRPEAEARRPANTYVVH